MPLRRLRTIALALSAFLALGLITALLALRAAPRAETARAAIELMAPI